MTKSPDSSDALTPLNIGEERLRSFCDALGLSISQDIHKQLKELLSVDEFSTDDELLTRGESAEFLGISVRTLSSWERRGLVERVEGPGRPRYRTSQLMKLRNDGMLTKKQAAALMKVSPRTIDNWRLKGKLRMERDPAGRLRFRLRDLLGVR